MYLRGIFGLLFSVYKKNIAIALLSQKSLGWFALVCLGFFDL